MYSECVRCPKLGAACKGPRFSDMSPPELIAWCKERKKHLGLTNAKLAELSGMSPGTIDSLLANSHADFKFGTISPLLQVLVGGKWQGDPCTDLNSTAGAEIKEKIRQLEADIRHKEETIRHYEDQISSMKTLITNTNARHASSQDFLREQLRGRNKAVAVLSFFLGVCLLAIIGALVIDKLNPNIGFFWLDEFASWLNTSSVIRGNA